MAYNLRKNPQKDKKTVLTTDSESEDNGKLRILSIYRDILQITK